MGEGTGTVPLDVRIAFAHASVQFVADAHHARVLHLKGAALDPALIQGRSYSDADVLAAPGDVDLLLRLLPQHGWTIINTFAFGSSFEHSATLRHRDFGLLDLHRYFPGMGPTPEIAFERLWEHRGSTMIGGAVCPVPDRAAQALVLLLHAARAGDSFKAQTDVQVVWGEATDTDRNAVLDWVQRLDSELPFSVITGSLHEHRSHRDYELWRVAAEGGTRFEEWKARFRSARGLRAKASVAGRSVLVNVEHLEIVRGRPVSRGEVISEFFARPLRGSSEVLRRRRSRATVDESVGPGKDHQ